MQKTNEDFLNPLSSGIIAFVSWGFFPLYWKLLNRVPVFEILLHRITWAALFAGLILAYQKTLILTFRQMRKPENLRLFAISSLLIGGNWFLYIWAVNSNQVLESSFGYFINPLMSVALGRFAFNEKLNRAQTFALILAGSGVLFMSWTFGRIPWIALALAGSFALYGLVRKKAPAGTVRGLFIESSLLAPVAIIYWIWNWFAGSTLPIETSWSEVLLLVGSGIVTGIPLLAFGTAVTRLPLSTIGFLQYIAPTCQFLLAVLVFKEKFDSEKLISFGLIWAGLAVYSLDLGMRKRPDAPAPE